MPDQDKTPQNILLENADRAEDGGDPIVHFDDDDFSARTKIKIGEYFRQNIEESNVQSQGHIADVPDLTIFQTGDVNTGVHMARMPDDVRQNFESIGNSGFFDQDIIPGNAGNINSQNQLQASILLEELAGDTNIIASEVSRKIQENANFGPDRLYITPDSPTEENAGTGRHTIQGNFGAHSPRRLFGEVPTNSNSTLTIQQLKNIGTQILMEASGEIYIPQNPSDPGQALAASIATGGPGISRLGFRVDANRFGAEEVLNKVDGNIERPAVEISLRSGTRGSYGNVNNPFVPFSAISSGASSIIVGSLLIGTFAAAFTALAESLKGIAGTGVNSIVSPGSQTSADIGRRRLGNYVARNQDTQNPNFGLALLQLQQPLLIETNFDYTSALKEGVKIFFGIDTNSFEGAVSSAASVSAARLVESPGYYNGILRMLVRSVSDPLASITGNVSSLLGQSTGNTDIDAQIRGPGDYNPLIGPATDPLTIIESVKQIKDSRFLKFMNVLATMGDVSLMTAQQSSSQVSAIDSVKDDMERNRPGTTETEIIPNPAALIRKNRLSDRISPEFNNTLAWGANTLPSLYMVNDQIQEAERLFGNTSNYSGLLTKRNFTSTTNKRLANELVQQLEKELDTYYMPFYFHDLRTNEIISFHAFIDNISDSFSADYTETEGYGRIGKVYTYKNTNRTINLSFKVVSVNGNDFDEMWLKLNKILMMLYPQYTLGRTLNTGAQKFIQPFSQLPGASPMIRLRVGDLIKSNFSEFDLARLFGLGGRDFNVSSQVAAQSTQRRDNIQTRIRDKSNSQRGGTFNQGDTFYFAHPIEQIGDRSGANVIISRDSDAVSTSATAARQRELTTARATSRSRGVPAIPVGARAVVTQIIGDVADKTYRIRFEGGLANEAPNAIYRVNFANAAPSPTAYIRIDIANITSQAEAEEPQSESDSAAFQQTSTDIQNFFNPDDTGGSQSGGSSGADSSSGTSSATGGASSAAGGNPIFKSFASTSGKGLAGFIKTIRFNWEGALWETEAVNSKAPKWCVVEMEFAPVQDLNPGLDVNGNMIAPIYNIGGILQQMKIERASRRQSQDDNTRLATASSTTSTVPTSEQTGTQSQVSDPTGVIAG
jgi:hypothetical protein